MKLSLKLWLDYYVGGVLLGFLKLPTMLLGALLGRNHSLEDCHTLTYLKLMGGGSLVIAYPSLLALKRNPRIHRLQIVTTPAIEPFAASLGVFDEILVIRDRSAPLLLLDSFRVLRRLFRTDAIIDLEIFSRLTTIFGLLSCARNRVGFYTNASFWRKNISTHLLFCNVSNGIFESYDQVARLFGAVLPNVADARHSFRELLALDPPLSAPLSASLSAPLKRIGVAAGCSDLSRERMLATGEWVEILSAKANDIGPCVFEFLGGKGDRKIVREVVEALGPGFETRDLAGQLSLRDSVRHVAGLDELICIDSALLHFSRLVGTPVQAYFGPTDPRVLLRPMEPAQDRIHYTKISCSPCVHLASRAPCHGNNLCMRYAVNPEAPGTRSPIWVEEEA